MACRLALVLAVVASITVVTGHKGKCCNRAAKLKRKKISYKKALSDCEAHHVEYIAEYDVNVQLYADKDQLLGEKEQLLGDKEQLTAEKEQLTADKE